MPVKHTRELSPMHMAGHIVGYVIQGAQKTDWGLPHVTLGHRKKSIQCGELFPRGLFYKHKGLTTRAAWRELKSQQSLDVISGNMAREVIASLAGPFSEAIGSRPRSVNKEELRHTIRSLSHSECDLDYSGQILAELRALTGHGSLKAYEERVIEFVQVHLATIQQVAQQLSEGNCKPNVIGTLKLLVNRSTSIYSI